MRNLIIVLSGPSGVGKGTIKDMLMADGGYSFSISYTTRDPRDGEVHGRDYYFITDEKFDEILSKDGFLEYDRHFKHSYGTPRAFVEDRLKYGDVILDIEVNGGLQVKRERPDETVLIMILPPDKEELRRRLLKRDTESRAEIEERVSRMDYELSHKDDYDYTVINDDLETAVLEIKNIIKREKERKI